MDWVSLKRALFVFIMFAAYMFLFTFSFSFSLTLFSNFSNIYTVQYYLVYSLSIHSEIEVVLSTVVNLVLRVQRSLEQMWHHVVSL